jgi:hypothetical protein
MLKTLPQLKRCSGPWTPLQRRAWLVNRRRHARSRLPAAPAMFVGFPDGGVSANGYDMTANELLLHFDGNLLDTSGNGRDVTPYSGGQWAGPVGDANDIAFSPLPGGLSSVHFNWAGGTSETYIGPEDTVIFWIKIDYADTVPDGEPVYFDGFNQPLVCFSDDDQNYSGLLLMGGIPFLTDPPRAAGSVTLDLSHGTMNGICEWQMTKFEWHQVAMVSTGSNHKVYVDGVLAAEGDTVPFESYTHMRLGGWYQDSQLSISPWVSLAELAVFSRAMDAAEVADIYSKQNQ